MGVGDNGGEKRVTWGTSSTISPFTLLFVLVALAGSLCRVLSRPFSFPEELDLLDSLLLHFPTIMDYSVGDSWHPQSGPPPPGKSAIPVDV